MLEVAASFLFSLPKETSAAAIVAGGGRGPWTAGVVLHPTPFLASHFQQGKSSPANLLLGQEQTASQPPTLPLPPESCEGTYLKSWGWSSRGAPGRGG